jgi:hypothetical protein
VLLSVGFGPLGPVVGMTPIKGPSPVAGCHLLLDGFATIVKGLVYGPVVPAAGIFATLQEFAIRYALST